VLNNLRTSRRGAVQQVSQGFFLVSEPFPNTQLSGKTTVNPSVPASLREAPKLEYLADDPKPLSRKISE